MCFITFRKSLILNTTIFPSPFQRPKNLAGKPAIQVVGGSDKGGILVRKGQDLKSEQCADRGSAERRKPCFVMGR
jgi:hypothetical protein